MTKTEVQVNLNSSELGILMSALQCVESREECQIEKEHGSLSTLYNRLNDLSVGMDLCQHLNPNPMSNLPSNYNSWVDNMKEPVTPATNPELWYQWYSIVKEDAPFILDTFIENTAAKMELTVDYFVAEFLPNE